MATAHVGSLATRLRVLRGRAEEAFLAGVAAVEPRERTREAFSYLIRSHAAGGSRTSPVSTAHGWSFSSGRPPARLIVVGAGKAAPGMAAGLEDAVVDSWGAGLPTRVEGVVARAGGRSMDTRWVEITEAGHPLPDERSEKAGRRMLAAAAGAGPDDLVVVLISGGASSLMAVPAEGLALDDLRITSELLLRSGASIREVNAFRKHLSAISGGLLGLAAERATVVCLLLSDVVGDDPSVIGSGPMFGDSSTFGDCLWTAASRDLLSALPVPVRSRLERGAAGSVAETPAPDDIRLSRIHHEVVARGLDACRAAVASSEKSGFHTLLLSHMLQGEAGDLGVVLAGVAAGIHGAGVPLAAPCAVVSGGECTVTMHGNGRGGRNQETCLAAVPFLEGLPAVLLSAGTDGVDGNTDAAGGLVDGLSLARAAARRVDIGSALARNDSGAALRAMGDLVRTGPTGTNVADLRVMLVES